MKKIKIFSNMPYILSILLILVQIVRWDLVDILTPFLWPFIEYGVYGVFFVWFAVLFIKMLIKLRRREMSLIKPVVFMLVSFLVTYFVDFTGLWLDYNFKSKFDDRMEVIKMVRGKQLVPNVEWNNGMIHLPEKYKHVSIGGGDIVFDQNFVFFWTFRGILDHSSGFVYSDNGAEPSQDFQEHNAIYKVNENCIGLASVVRAKMRKWVLSVISLPGCLATNLHSFSGV